MVKKHANTTISTELEKDLKTCESGKLVNCYELVRGGSSEIGWVWLRAHLVAEAAGTCPGACILCIPTQLGSAGHSPCLHQAFLMDEIMLNQKQNYYAQIVP